MSRWIALLLLLITMTGCDPQLNLAGAYIPGWMACLVGGIFGFWILHLIFLKSGLLPYLKPLPLVYAALMALLSCVIWLLFFASR